MQNNKIKQCLYNYSSLELFYGALFFVFHFCIEVICYSLLYRKYSDFVSIIVILIYDFFAFVPQAIVGDFHNKHKNFNIGLVGVLFFLVSILLIDNENLFYLSIFSLAIANAILHEVGAIATISVSDRHIFPSSLFVSGGVFGIYVGRILARANTSIHWLYIPLIFILLVVCLTSKRWCKEDIVYTEFDIIKNVVQNNPVDCSQHCEFAVVGAKFHEPLIVIIIVVATRSFLGFILPTGWRETTFDLLLLYSSLGIGKAMGGLLCDVCGYRITTIISTLCCIPFIIIGNFNRELSLIGILLFSMNMSITYAIALNIIKQNPGVAFGITTIGLVIGILPMLFIELNFDIVVIVVVILSVICYKLLDKILL